MLKRELSNLDQTTKMHKNRKCSTQMHDFHHFLDENFVSNVITAQFSIPISTEAKAENMHKSSSYTHLINQNSVHFL